MKKLIKLSQVSVRGADHEFPVYFDMEAGRFVTHVGDQEIRSGDFDHLHRLVKDAITGTRLDVAFLNLYGRKGTMRGFHATRQVVLVTWEDGEKGELASHEWVVPGDTPAEVVARLRTLAEEESHVSDRLKAIRRERTDMLDHFQVRPDQLLSDALGENLFTPHHRRPE